MLFCVLFFFLSFYIQPLRFLGGNGYGTALFHTAIAMLAFWAGASPSGMLQRHLMVPYREGSFGYVHAGVPPPEGPNATSIFAQGNGTTCEFVKVPDTALGPWFSHPTLNGHHWPEQQSRTNTPSRSTWDLGASLSWCCAQGPDCGGVELSKMLNGNGIGLNLSAPDEYDSSPGCRPHRKYSNEDPRHLHVDFKDQVAYTKRRCSFDTVAHAQFWAWYCLVGVLLWFSVGITSLGRAIRLRGVSLPWCKRMQRPTKTFYWKVVFEKDGIAAHQWCTPMVLCFCTCSCCICIFLWMAIRKQTLCSEQ